MHRRARHLTGRAAGAQLYFDSRRITGLSDGTGVQTWSDLSTNSNDATQATSANRPLYKVNIQGGCPMLSFDGTNDVIVCGSAATLGSGCTIVSIFQTNNPNSYPQHNIFFYYGNSVLYIPYYNWIGVSAYNGSFYFGNYNNPTEGSIAASANNNYRIFSGVVNDSNTNRLFLEGIQKSTGSSTSITGISSSARPTMGAFGNLTQAYLSGYLGILGYWSTVMNASLRRRFEQAAGFSFKLACS